MSFRPGIEQVITHPITQKREQNVLLPFFSFFSIERLPVVARLPEPSARLS